MDRDELQENAWIDYMGARQSALEAAVGHFVTMNVPTSYLTEVVRSGKSSDLIVFAAQIALHQRGEEWRVPSCGSTNSETKKAEPIPRSGGRS